jgi:hypothetical protein
MTPEVVRPRRRISPGRVLLGLVIAWSGWYASRVVSALEQADRAAPIERGPACTSTVYYDGGVSGWYRP